MLHMGLKNPVAQTSLVQVLQGAEPRVVLKVFLVLHVIQSVPSGTVSPLMQFQKLRMLIVLGQPVWLRV